jgi:chromosome segregation ATPase
LLTLDQEHRKLTGELEESNRWAESLNRELEARIARILELQKEQQGVHAVVQGYEAKIAELEQENRAKTKWAEGLDSELAGKMRELAQCVEYLHQAEKTVEERTRWAQGLQADVERLRGQLALVEASRWMRLGHSVGLGPELELK